VLDPGGLGIGVGLGDADRIDIHPKPARAVFLRRGDRDPAVAAAQIDYKIIFLDVRQREHPIDHVLGGRDVGGKLWSVRLLGLGVSTFAADGRFGEVSP
jgi:hypothetical protein